MVSHRGTGLRHQPHTDESSKAEPLKRHRRARNANGPVDFSTDLAYKMTQYHKKYEFNDEWLTNLDKYNDALPYRITETQEAVFVDEELNRLIAAARTSEPLVFSFARGDLDEKAMERRPLTFQEVNNVVHQIQSAFAVILLDNACISFKHCRNEIEETTKIFQMCHARLGVYSNHEPSQARGREPRQLVPPRRNAELFHSLINHLTATLARTLAQMATGGQWLELMVSMLAEVSLKAKVLSVDLPAFAQKSMENASAAMAETKTSMEEVSKDSFTVVIDAKKAQKSELNITERYSRALNRYHESKTIISKLLVQFLMNPLQELAVDGRPMAPDCFENHCAIYQVSPSTKPFTVSCNRESEVVTSQMSFDTDLIQQVMYNTYATIQELKEEERRSIAQGSRKNCAVRGVYGITEDPDPPDDDLWSIRLRWGMKTPKEALDNKIRPHHLYARAVDVAVSAIIPLWLGQGEGPNLLRRLITMTMSMASEDDPVIMFEPRADYTAFYVTVTSKDWRQRQQDMTKSGDTARDHTLRSFAHSPWQQKLLDDNFHSSSQRNSERDKEFRKRLRELSDSYEKARPEIGKWTFGRTKIVVKRTTYVTSVMMLALSIVLGGMAIPFAVGARINGVDPFQLTTFTWVFALAVLVFFKSWYVSDWPWHDFIQRVVVCRSVSDLCDVTGMDAQIILIHLLITEHQNTLFTEGPHNSMFRNATEGGFEIDVPTDIESLFLSNFVPVKVFDHIGIHLVCLDVRKTKHSLTISRQLGCLGHRNLEETLEDDGIVKLSMQRFDIGRVLGVFVGKTKFGGTKRDERKKES